MGYGILRIDFTTLKAALYLPDDCQITAVRHFYDGGDSAQVDLVIASASFPETPVEKLPQITAICTVERPVEHLCPDGFECKKIATKLEIRE